MDSITSRLLDPITQRTGHVVNLQENVDSLKNAMNELKCVRDDVKTRVDVAERQKLKRTHYVHWWLQKVESIETEVNAMVEESKKVTRTSWSGYQLCKKVAMKLDDVVKLKSKVDSFDVVAEKPLPDAIEELPCTSAVGMDLMLSNALGLISEDEVGIFGIYGMGGVGKTTLLKKINNEFLVITHEFAFIIWVVVSKELNVEKIQKDIGQRLGLSWVENESNNETRARDIYKVLRGKKFMLLLDDLWERLDLEMVGIPHPSSQSMSKVVLTTRFEDVCGHMAANKKISVECLPEQEAMNLFKQNVGEETMISHQNILALAMKIIKKCKGLPLALITIGRAMACKKTPQEWEHAISVLITSKPPSEISDGFHQSRRKRGVFSFEDWIPKELAKIAIQRGMWGVVKKMDVGVQAYLLARLNGAPFSRYAVMARFSTKNLSSILSLPESESDNVDERLKQVEISEEPKWTNHLLKWLVVGGVLVVCGLNGGAIGKGRVFGIVRGFRRVQKPKTNEREGG